MDAAVWSTIRKMRKHRNLLSAAENRIELLSTTHEKAAMTNMQQHTKSNSNNIRSVLRTAMHENSENAKFEVLRLNATKVQLPNTKKNRAADNCPKMKTRSDTVRNRITFTQTNLYQPYNAGDISVVENIVQNTVPNVGTETGRPLRRTTKKPKMTTRSQSRLRQINNSTVSNQQISAQKVVRRSERLRKINVIS